MARHLAMKWLPLAEAAEVAGKGSGQGALVSIGREIAAWNAAAPVGEQVLVLRKKGGRGAIDRVEPGSLARMLLLKARRQMADEAARGAVVPGGEAGDGGQVSTRGAGGGVVARDATTGGGRRRARRASAPAALRTFPEGQSPFDRRQGAR